MEKGREVEKRGMGFYARRDILAAEQNLAGIETIAKPMYDI